LSTKLLFEPTRHFREMHNPFIGLLHDRANENPVTYVRLWTLFGA